MKMRLSIYIVTSCSLLVACGGGDSSTLPVQPSANTEQSVAAISSSSSSEAESAYLIGGTISGLMGSGLVLQNKNGDDITINGDGNFYFSTKLANKKTYDVLWEYEKNDVELAIKIRDVWSTFSMCKSMVGLGGCELKTLKRLINESTRVD